MYTLCPPEPLSYKSAFVFLGFSVLVDLALFILSADRQPVILRECLIVHLPFDGAILECMVILGVLELRA